MATPIAGKPLALIGLAQSAIHPTGRYKFLQSHSLFSIKSYHRFACRTQKSRPAIRLTGLVARVCKKRFLENWVFSAWRVIGFIVGKDCFHSGQQFIKGPRKFGIVVIPTIIIVTNLECQYKYWPWCFLSSPGNKSSEG